jgi:hypothetical protein
MLLALLLAACGPSTKANIDGRLTGHAIGPVWVGMPVEELRSLGSPVTWRDVTHEGEPYREAIVSVDHGEIVASFATDRVFEVSTTSPAFRFDRGAHVGSSIDDLKAVFPEGELIGGWSEELFLHFVVGDGGGVFRFDASGLSEECLVFSRDCPPNLGLRPATSYFVQ